MHVTNSNLARLMSRPRRHLAVAGLAVAVLALAACGGSDSAGGTRGSGDDASPATGVSLAQVKKDGAITVGTEGTYRPFSFHEGGSGDLTGYDVEVMRAVADELGVEATFKETQWDAMFAGLDAGRFDVIANQVSITPERQKDYSFSTPYTVSPGVVVVRKDDDSIKTFGDLKGRTTAQSLTSNWYQLAKDAGANIQNVEGWAQAVTLLKQGRVDATINDKLTYLDYVQSEGDTGLKVAVETDDRSESALTFRQGSDDLVKAVDTALDKLRKDGTLAKISEKYFGEDVSG